MRKIFKNLWRTILWTIVAFFALSIVSVVVYRWLPVYYSPLMFIRLAQQVDQKRQLHLVHHWVSLEDMSSDLPLAVMSSEDQNFFKHNGFDFEQIKIAYEEAQNGGRVRGASTISQQTAKNVFLWPESSWLRKGLEAYFTVLIEVLWDKHRIMEVYLNTIEMGDGIYGAEAVAHEHFGCSASQLSRHQCAMIAATLPNPLRFDSAHPTRYMYRRQSAIMRQMRNLVRFPSREEMENGN